MTRDAAIVIFTSNAELRAAIAEQADLFSPASLRWAEQEEAFAAAIADAGAGLAILDEPPPERIARLSALPRCPRLLVLTGPESTAGSLAHAPNLAKPFRMRDLARLALRLLKPGGDTGLVSLGDAVFDPVARTLTHRDTSRSAALTEKESAMLHMLSGSPKEEVNRDRMLRDIWGYADHVSTHTLETHLYRLRGKMRDIAGERLRIRAVGDGYLLEIED